MNRGSMFKQKPGLLDSIVGFVSLDGHGYQVHHRRIAIMILSVDVGLARVENDSKRLQIRADGGIVKRKIPILFLRSQTHTGINKKLHIRPIPFFDRNEQCGSDNLTTASTVKTEAQSDDQILRN
eukprot:m.48517 g.48517  ORF g.48517 m.48517 type:complete len:125 (-) comp47744_c0_seq1:581-955(-)